MIRSDNPVKNKDIDKVSENVIGLKHGPASKTKQMSIFKKRPVRYIPLNTQEFPPPETFEEHKEKLYQVKKPSHPCKKVENLHKLTT